MAARTVEMGRLVVPAALVGLEHVVPRIPSVVLVRMV